MIRRERIVKAETIKYYQKEIVAELIKSELAPSGQFETAYFHIFQAGAESAFRYSAGREAGPDSFKLVIVGSSMRMSGTSTVTVDVQFR